MTKSQLPIGFFDSGVGGTSIWKDMIRILPYENTIYLADSANAPYGKKTKKEMLRLCNKNTEHLLNKSCKMIVVACNTATTNAIAHLRASYSIPFIGIEPAIKPAALQTQTKCVGILATKGTLSSALFVKTSGEFAKNIKVIETVGEGLVELVEDGEIHGEKARKLLAAYIEPMLEKSIDHLILGCTHYPYLMSEIKKITGNRVKIIDTGEAVSKQIQKVLQQKKLLNKQPRQAEYQFYTNKNPHVLQHLLGDITTPVKVDFWDF